MFPAFLVVAVLCSFLHTIAVAAHPASAAEPGVVTAILACSDAPFDMAIPSTPPSLVAREWEWTPSAPIWTPSASAPIWTPSASAWTPDFPQSRVTPLVETIFVTQTLTTSTPFPTPTYTYAETHDDSKNTLTHEMIAGIILGIFVVVPILGCCFTAVYRKCGGACKKKEEDADAKDVETGDVQLSQRGGQSVEEEDRQRLITPPAPPPMAHWSQSRTTRNV
jgi:hypothetical protein